MSGAWTFAQISEFVRLLRKDVGSGWDWMVPAVREALVHQKAFAIVRAQDRVAVSVKDMNKLLHVMLIVAGLEEFDPEEFGLQAAAQEGA